MRYVILIYSNPASRKVRENMSAAHRPLSVPERCHLESRAARRTPRGPA